MAPNSERCRSGWLWRASPSLSPAPPAVLVGAGEGAARVSEESGFDQTRRDRGAVHGDERSLLALTTEMDGSRDQLLAGAALAGDEDGGSRILLHELDFPEDPLHGRALADKPGQPPLFRLTLRYHRQLALQNPALSHCPFELAVLGD